MKRQYGIDFARLLAAYLVAVGHLAFGGTFAVDEAYQRWAYSGTTLPLLDKEKQNLWFPDYSLLVNWQTSGGIFGVGLFFVISGWVVPPMLKKYTSLQFLANRALRIFPMLWISVLLAATIQYVFGESDELSISAVLSTMLLLNDFTGDPFTLGVVWTLVVEFKFYLLLALVGELTHRKSYLIAATAVVMCLFHFGLLQMGAATRQPWLIAKSAAILLDLHFIVLMLIGASLYLVLSDKERVSKWRYAYPLVLLVAFNVLREIIVKQFGIRPYQDINFVTQMAVLVFFLACVTLQRYAADMRIAHFVHRISDITYSLYLLHLSLGIFLISVLRTSISNQYLLVFVVLLAISLLSFASFHLIEKRCIYRVAAPKGNAVKHLG